jgi:prolipoprotein diacylglyceryltransferase
MRLIVSRISNDLLDRLVRPGVHIFRGDWPAYQICGYAGAILGVCLAMALAIRLDLSLSVMFLIVTVAVLTFFALVVTTKIILGEERITYYHHEIAVIGAAALLLWSLKRPVLPYLDLTILGVGVFLVCGRIGCLMVGCCHGRPHRWGVRYRNEHAAVGFPHYLVGSRLFPIQLVESLWALCIVFVGAVFALRGDTPGEALAWYVVAYDLGRFCFEFMRGDSNRHYFGGFSEAQWTSLLLLCLVVWGELSGVLPYNQWHARVTACLILAMAVIAIKRRVRKTDTYRLLHACHINELAETLGRASDAAMVAAPAGIASAGSKFAPRIHMSRTSLGVQISVGRVQNEDGCFFHYTLSSRDEYMTKETAGTLAGVICRLKHSAGSVEIVERGRGVFHLLVRTPLVS